MQVFSGRPTASPAALVGRQSRSVVPFVPVCLSRKLSATKLRRRSGPVPSNPGQQHYPRGQAQVCRSGSADDKLISSTEVPAFIPRDDLMDQMLSWAKIEAAEGGQRNFGLPMTVQPTLLKEDGKDVLWGYVVSIFREGNKVCDISVSFDRDVAKKAEYIGIGEDGFPTKEGRLLDVMGKNFEIWKLGSTPVDEDLRSTIRAFCTALAQALNRYYAFGSVFVDDAQ